MASVFHNQNQSMHTLVVYNNIVEIKVLIKALVLWLEIFCQPILPQVITSVTKEKEDPLKIMSVKHHQSSVLQFLNTSGANGQSSSMLFKSFPSFPTIRCCLHPPNAIPPSPLSETMLFAQLLKSFHHLGPQECCVVKSIS